MAQGPPVQMRPPQMRPNPVGPFSSDKNHTDPARWICIYPAYLDSGKSRSEGRLLAKDKCLPTPSILEIRDVLVSAGFQPIIENKKYPRERSLEFEYRGRVRVQLRKEDGSPLNQKFPNRESIFEAVCELIPQLKTRTAQKSGQENDPEAARKKSKKK